MRIPVPRAGTPIQWSACSRPWLARLLLALALLVALPGHALELHALSPSVGDAPAERVLSGNLDAHFQQALPLEVVLPPSREPRWFRLDLDTDTEPHRRLLTIGRLPMRQLDVWLPNGRGGFVHRQRSFFSPDPERFTPSAFVFELPAGLTTGQVYLRIEHGGRLLLSVALRDHTEFLRREQRFEASITAAATVLAVMLLINLVFALALRERLYGFYVAFLAAQMLWVLYASGIGFALPGGTTLGSYPGSLSGTLITLANALMLQFARVFVELPERHPTLDRPLRALTLGFVALSLAFALPFDVPQRWLGLVASAVFAALPVLLLAALLRATLAGSRPAALFLLAWLPLGAFGAWRTLISLGLAPPRLFTLYAPLYAVAFESIVLSLALAWRMLQLRIERDRARFFADFDPLTGGYSRRAGEERLHTLLAAHQQQGRALSLAFFDLDRLKEINDLHGHGAGDACLRTIGERARSALAGGGDLVRWGGDEFLVLLPDRGLPSARQWAEQLIDAVRAAPADIDGVALPLAISIGLTSATLADHDPQALIERADRALYAAKRDGRNRVVVAEPRPTIDPCPA